MSFCQHCEGQRFDRSRVLRILRESQKELRRSTAPTAAQDAVASIIDAIRRLDIPHLELDEVTDDDVVH